MVINIIDTSCYGLRVLEVIWVYGLQGLVVTNVKVQDLEVIMVEGYELTDVNCQGCYVLGVSIQF